MRCPNCNHEIEVPAVAEGMAAMTFRVVPEGPGEWVIRMANSFCSGWLSDDHEPPSGSYNYCGVSNQVRAAFRFRSQVSVEAAVAYLEIKGYTRVP